MAKKHFPPKKFASFILKNAKICGFEILKNIPLH